MLLDQIAGQGACASPDVDRSISNNNDLVAGLYRQHHDSLVRFCRRALGQYGNGEDAAELVQDAYHRLVRRVDAQAIEHPRAFLYHTVRNLAKNRRRDQYNRSEQLHFEITDVSEAELVSREASPERVVQLRQDLVVLRAALKEMPEKRRFIFALRKFEGRSYQEIADHMGMSVNGIKKQLHKAVRHLEVRMAEADRQVVSEAERLPQAAE